jgi:hypothetical protein
MEGVDDLCIPEDGDQGDENEQCAATEQGVEHHEDAGDQVLEPEVGHEIENPAIAAKAAEPGGGEGQKDYDIAKPAQCDGLFDRDRFVGWRRVVTHRQWGTLRMRGVDAPSSCTVKHAVHG